MQGEPLRLACDVFLALFAIGLASSLAFAAFVLAFTLAHADNMAHDFALPIRTLWLLILVPWGAGFSVDELCRRYFFRRFNTEPSRLYGLATWIPMLMLGLAYAAAAYAKLDELGFRSPPGRFRKSWVRFAAARAAIRTPTRGVVQAEARPTSP